MAKKQTRSPVEVAIHQRNLAIERLEASIAKVRRAADEEIAGLRRRIERNKMVLTALKAGTSK